MESFQNSRWQGVESVLFSQNIMILDKPEVLDAAVGQRG